MRRVVLAVVAVILVNLPWAHDAWVQHQLDSSGVHTKVTIVEHTHKRGQNFVSYRFARSIDPQQRLFAAVVSDRAYREATTTGRLPATVLKGSPASNRVEGEVTGSQVIVIAVVGDAIIVLLVGFSLLRRRRWSRFRVVGVEDDLVTLMLGRLELTAQLADDPDTRARIQPAPGARIRGVLYLEPSEDVVEGPPLGEVTQLAGAEYRVAGRVRSVTATSTDLVLDNGYVLPVCGDEVEHEAELRGPAVATGRLILASSRPL
ncbi:MAG: hypothetical protein ACTHJM_06735 [Marmoricola sp.]